MSKVRTSALMTTILLCVLAVMSLLLAFGFGASPTAVTVESVENNIPVVSAVESHGTHSGWTELTNAMKTGTIENTKNTEAKYYLTKNFSDVKITIKGKITLCLNNYCLDGGSNGSVITVAAGATFTLCDCKHDTDGPGRIRYGNAETGGGVHVNGKSSTAAGGKFIMKGGAIRLCTAVRGGAVWVGNGAEFELQYGRIRMNNAKSGTIGSSTTIENGNGAGVYVATGGKFTMTGGELLQNTAQFSGGGVYVANSEDAGTTSGVFDMQDGLIANNVAQNGGGVSLNKGAFQMSGGTIGGTQIGDSVVNGDLSAAASRSGGNTASVRGGGVFNAGGSTTISGNAKIKFNNAPVENELGGGGGIHVVQNSAGKTGFLTITGGEISNNESWRGGGVFAGQNSEFTISGGSITDNTANNGNGGGVHVLGGTVNISGNTVISKNKFAEGISGSGGGMFVASVFDSSGNKTNEGNVTMSGGSITENTANNGGGVLLDRGTAFTLSGGEIKGNTSSAHGGGVYMGSNAKLTMTAGKINGNEATGNSGGGVCIAGDVSGAAGEFTMEGGEVNGNTASFGGGISSIGDVAIKSGTVSGNNATGSNGGGIFAQNKTLTLENATVSNNTAATTGGGVYVNNGCAFSMTSGEISGNSASSGGGAYVDSEFTLSGGTISGNKITGSNINSNTYLAGGKTITISSALKSGTRVGVTMPSGATAYVFTTGYGANNKTGDNVVAPTQYFFADNGACLWVNAANEAAVGHNITDHQDYKKATCFEDGYNAYWYCDVCETYYSNAACTTLLTVSPTIPKGHNTQKVSAVEANCFHAGNTEYVKCNECGTCFDNDTNFVEREESYYIIAQKEHVWALDTNHADYAVATCEESGVNTFRCSNNCGTTRSETVPKLDHAGKVEPRENAECLKVGRYAYFLCTKGCGLYRYDVDGDGEYESSSSKLEDTVMPASGHYYGNPVEDPVWDWSNDYTKATAKFICKTCGDEHIEDATIGDKPLTIPQTCTVDGSITYTATVTYSDYGTFTKNEVQPLYAPGHSWTDIWDDWTQDATTGEWTITVTFSCSATAPHSEVVTTGINVGHSTTTAPDCIHIGIETWTASVQFNGTTYYAPDKEVAIAATNMHNYNVEKTDLEPTCTTTGSKSMHCSVCDASNEATKTSVPALGHDWEIKVTDGSIKEYTAFDAFRLNGLNVTFTCKNDKAKDHTHTFMGGTDAATIKYVSGNCLHVDDTSITFTTTIPVYGEYTCTVNGIDVSQRAAENVVWEYSSNNTHWTELAKNASFEYAPNKTYTVRVSFDKHTADSAVNGNKYVYLFDDKFSNAGGYSYTLTEYGNYSIGDSSRSLTVNKKQINAGGASWVSGGVELMDGYVVLQADGKYKYYPEAPDGSTPKVTNAVVRYVSGNVTVAYPIPTAHNGIYEVAYGSSTVTAGASGMYTAIATLTLCDSDNYEFLLAGGTTGATLEVTKVWYAAICDNGFVGRIDGWRFGQTASALPALEQDDGQDETVTLVLKRGEEVIGEFNRGQYSHYVNSAMPVGSYTLIATVGAVTDGEGVEYEGFANYPFTFTVSAAQLAITNEAALKNTVTAIYNGKLHINETAPIAAILTTRQGVWSDAKYDDLYATELTKTFGIAANGAFVSADDLKSNANKYFINAGNYTAYYLISALNYEDVTGSFAVQIAKATYDLKDVAFGDKTVTYKKSVVQSLVISGLPTGVDVVYDGNDHINANESGYVVTATLTFADKDNYKFINSAVQNDTHIESDTKAVYTATLTILKDTYSFTVNFSDGNFVYDGEPHSIYIDDESALPEGVTVTYVGNGRTDADSYTVTAKFAGDYDNYNTIQDMTATLLINKAVVSLNLEFKDADFDYDGNQHRIELTGLTEELLKLVDVAYTNRSGVNDGTYNATATVTLKDPKNYMFAPGTKTYYEATLNIIAKELDMDDVRFEGMTVTYTGKAYSLSISGTLPAGVTYSYENNSRVEVGTHKVTVHFYAPSNYGKIEDMTAELKIVPATYKLNVSFPDATVAYTGNAHSLSLRGVLPAGVTYTYVNNSRTDVGSQIVTVKFFGDTHNYNAIPDMTATLRVVPASIGVTNVSLEGRTLTYDGNMHNLVVNGELPDGVTVRYYYIDEDGNEVEFNGAMEAGTYDVIARFVLADSENYREVRPLTAKLTILAVEEPVRPPVVVEPSVAEINAPIADNQNYDQQANAVEGEIVPSDDFPYWIIAVCVIAAEVVAMAVMGCYMAFRSYKKKKR